MRATSTKQKPAFSAIAADVLAGLTSRPKSLPPWLFYDAAGSELFERITQLPEYYLTRTEAAILRGNCSLINRAAGFPGNVVELGAGTACKTRILLESLVRARGSATYFPVDVSESALAKAADQLRDLPGLTVHPLVADYTESMEFLAHVPAPRLVMYIGSSIGNFEPLHAALLLSRLRARMAAMDSLLLGADMSKNVDVLVRAYDDAAGVTAEFNRNLLMRINRELDADFDPELFAHVARWNHAQSRIEMHLESERAQEVTVRAIDLHVRFKSGETIHTENSYKFTPVMVNSVLRNGGLVRECSFYDSRRWFGLHLARPA
ncbi:MAG: L-histidine N(alpha)-methyltransferase [Terriglobales bacterium]